jgi:hypothetical protein
MRVPRSVLDYAKKKLMPLSKELPDEIIGPGYRWRKNSGEPPGHLHKPFLKRWFVLPKNQWCNIYLHQFMRDDEDRALHDHPWWNVSLLLIGQYIEVTAGKGRRVHPQQVLPEQRKMYQAGDLKFRLATTAHRIELVRTRLTGHKRTRRLRERGQPSWSLFITGPILRPWGFHCASGWREQHEFHERGGCE